MKTLLCGCTIEKPCAEHERESKMTVPDLALIRRAILSVIDDGDPLLTRSDGRPGTWFLYDSGDEAFANEQRLKFCDAVSAYIIDRLAPALKGKGA